MAQFLVVYKVEMILSFIRIFMHVHTSLLLRYFYIVVKNTEYTDLLP